MFYKDGEFYSVSATENRFLVGGGNEEALLHNIKKDSMDAIVDVLEESVIFCKILEEKEECHFLVVTVAGMICLMTENRSINILEIKESVSTVVFIKNNLYIGTEIGNVYVYTSELEHINTVVTDCLILDIQISDEYVFILNDNGVYISDKYGNIIATKEIKNISSLKCIDGKVYGISVNDKFYVYKENTKLFEMSTEETVDSINFIDNSFVLGGMFDGFIFVNISNYTVFKMNVELNCIKDIRIFDRYKIIFIYEDTKIGIIDVRDKNSLFIVEPHVGLIFDFDFTMNYIIAGGVDGYETISI